MSFTVVQVRGQYRDAANNSPVAGQVSFRLSAALQDSESNRIIERQSVTATLDDTGAFAVNLVPTDDPTVSPQGATYLVTEIIKGALIRSYRIELPRALAGTGLDLADAAPAANLPTTSYVLISTFNNHRATVKDHLDWSDSNPGLGDVPVWEGSAYVPGQSLSTDIEVDSKVAAEAALRTAADASEATARANADTSEASTRAAADTAEASARTTGDTNTLASAHSYTDSRVVKAVIDALGIDAATLNGKSASTIESEVTAAIVNASPSTLDTLKELADALGDDPNFATTVATSIATKLAKASNLSDLVDVVTARTNLGLGSAATHPATEFESAGAAAAAQAASQPLDSDLTIIAALNSSTAGAMATDGSGWIRKTFAQLKTSLGLVKGDVGLGNVDNTSDANKPVSTAQATADALAVHLAGTETVTGTKDFAVVPTIGGVALVKTPDLDQEAPARAVFSDLTYKHAVVALRFDDTDSSDYATVYPLLKARHLPASFATVQGLIGTGAHMTYSQVVELMGRGHEIQAHSRTHGNPTTQTDPLANFVDEAITATAEMKAAGPLFMDSFVQPGTWTGAYYFDTTSKINDSVPGRLLRASFAAFEGYDQTEFDSTTNIKALPPVHRYGAANLGPAELLTLVTLQQAVDNAIRYGGMVEILFHSRFLGTGGYLSVADFTSFLDYLQTKRDAGLLDVLTPTGALYAKRAEAKVNHVRDSGFEDSATGSLHPAWVVLGGAPVIAASGRVGNAAQLNISNKLRQDWRSTTFRGVLGEAWVKAAVAGQTPTARVNFVAFDGVTNYVLLSHDLVVSDVWQRLRFHGGNHPSAKYIRIELQSTTSQDVLFDDVSLWKV